MSLRAPEPLNEGHVLDSFSCGYPDLDGWLRRTAPRNEGVGASRCFVVCDGKTVVGYYALAAGSVARSAAPGAIRRNMPEPVPVVVLGRLAVGTVWTGRGIGAGMLKDALLRSIRISRELGIRAMLCHAIDEQAKRFYLHHGFVESPIDPLTLMLNLHSPALRDILENTAR